MDNYYINIEEYIDFSKKIYAHKKTINKEVHFETLLEHSNLTKLKLEKIIQEKNLDNVINNFARSFFIRKEWQEKFKVLFYNTVYLHDLGKININFQSKKMKNQNFKHHNEKSKTSHSAFSGYLYIEIMLNHFKILLTDLLEFEKEEEEGSFIVLILLNSYIISKHHGSLGSFKDYIQDSIEYIVDREENEELLVSLTSKLAKSLQINEDNIEDLTYFYEENYIEKTHYIYSKLLFSLVIDSDIYATYEYMSGKSIESYGTHKSIKMFENIKKPIENSIYYNIEKHKEFLVNNENPVFPSNSINVLRSEMLLEAVENLNKNLKKDIFYLEAPTGAGKTVTSLKLASELIENIEDLNKVFYIFPFNTLVEQTKKSLDEILGTNQDKSIINNIAVVNSLTPIEVEESRKNNHGEEYDDDIFIKDYEKSLLTHEFMHYPIVLTSHVKLFNILFGNSKGNNYPLAHLANSVIILDEIQSYKNSIWREIIDFLHSYSELLNIKVIIMSATLPKLSYLTKNKKENKDYTKLILNREKYFESPLFKNRVEIDYTLLDIKSEDVFFELLKRIKKEKKKLILIEFQSKAKATDFYKLLKEEDMDIELLTGDDSPNERKRIINRAKKLNSFREVIKENFILISTQVVEAGVDIDMDLGFKDISLFDSEEQFMGRINRSCKKNKSKVYFFNLTKSSNIYKGDIRVNQDMTLENQWVRDLLQNKNTEFFYEKVMDNLKAEKDEIKDYIKKLSYIEIEKHMKLISSPKKVRVFFNRAIEVIINGEKKTLKGKEIWDKFINFLEEKEENYAKKKIELSYHLNQINEFIYEVYEIPNSYSSERFGIYYIEDGQEYFIDGKLDREKLKNEKKIDFDFIS